MPLPRVNVVSDFPTTDTDSKMQFDVTSADALGKDVKFYIAVAVVRSDAMIFMHIKMHTSFIHI